MDEGMAVRMARGLRVARLRAGLTLAQVAGAVRLSPEEYSRIERGKLLPSVPLLRDLCLTLRIRSDGLWHGGDGGAGEDGSAPA